MPLNLFNWLMAFSPVGVVLILMLGLRWGGSRAGAMAWFATIVVAYLWFGAGVEVIAYSQAKAILLSLDVLYVIWMALLLFHVIDEAGAIQIIGQALPALTGDRAMQGLLLGWLFASFLQGMGGFGVPVAVAAPLLVGLGFDPVLAVVMACIGHGWAVNFGSLATSFQTLMAVTGLPGEILGPDAAILLGIASLACGGIVAYIAAGWRGFIRSLPAVLILSAVMSFTQYWLVTNGIWTLGATGASLVGLIVSVPLARLPIYQKQNRDQPVSFPPQARRDLLIAFSAYIVLVVIAFAINLIEPLGAWLGQVTFSLLFPELATSSGWLTPAESGRRISLFNHPGAILLYASIIAAMIYGWAGRYSEGSMQRIFDRVLKGSVNASLGIVAMVGLAVLMSHAGMTHMLALGLSQTAGKQAYPLIAPFIGAMGAFITGSNNNSNVLFGILQQRTAELLGLSVTMILAAQTAGGSLGSVMAPAKVIVGSSTVGLGDRESEVMRSVILYGLIPIAAVAIAAFILVGLR